jgi:hypothetical protein
MQPQVKEIKVSKNFRITFYLIILCLVIPHTRGRFTSVSVSHDSLVHDSQRNFFHAEPNTFTWRIIWSCLEKRQDRCCVGRDSDPGGIRRFEVPRLPGRVAAPLAFFGQHSLIVYLVHQPVIILLLAALTGTKVL